MRILKQESLNIISTRFEDVCNLDFSVRKSDTDKAEQLFNRFNGVTIEKISEMN